MQGRSAETIQSAKPPRPVLVSILRVGRLTGFLIAMAFVASPVVSQEVAGQLLDHGSEAAIEGAEVRLLSGEAGHQVLAVALTDADGLFNLEARQSGRYRLQASRIGYRTVTSPPFDISSGETLAVELRASVEAVPLAPLTVLTSRPPLRNSIRLKAGGFYDRQDSWGKEGLGAGHFFDQDDLDQIRTFRVTDLLRGIPGVRVEAVGGRRQVVTMRTMTFSGGRCTPAIYIDGHIVRRSGDAENSIDDLISAPAVAAIEVYPGLTKPGQFTQMTSNPCGAVVIWTGNSG